MTSPAPSSDHPSRLGGGSARLLLLGVLVLALVVAGALSLIVTSGDSDSETGSDAAPDASTPLASRTSQISPGDFLDTYVEDDGRVVRLDQGGDTVSEGQAYGMLIALIDEDQERFDAVWSWTKANMMRPDGLISWRWENGAVVDPASASDAEIDMLRALTIASDTFEEPAYTAEALELGDAVLDLMTVSTPEGRVLVAGEWATSFPAWFNPSYVSPVTASLMADLSGDDRWSELVQGSRSAVQASAPEGQLPPNWAGLNQDGTVYPQNSPDGTAVEYGYDAARTLVRHAESCDAEDLEVAASGARVIWDNGANDPAQVRAVYDLGGGPRTENTSPLTTIAQAAGLAAADRDAEAVAALEQAGKQQQAAPTYYGDAWAVLGPALLSDPALGGCPPLEDVP